MNIHIYDLREPSLYTHSNGVVCLTCRDGDPIPAPTLPVVHLWFKDASAALAFLDACRMTLGGTPVAPLLIPSCASPPPDRASCPRGPRNPGALSVSWYHVGVLAFVVSAFFVAQNLVASVVFCLASVLCFVIGRLSKRVQ